MKIFISSTYRDLKEDREMLLASLRKANFISHGMEFFAASSETPKNECLQQVASSDLVILIIGDRYGSVDEDTDKSMTQLEYERAEELKLPVLAFMRQLLPDAQVDGKLDAFRGQVLSTKNVLFFEDTLSLMCGVWPSLFNYLFEKGMIVRRISTFQFWEEYIRPFLDPAKLFNHKHQFVGRDKELSALDKFLLDQTRRIAVVSGPGGVGKSKLIYEFINRSLSADWDFRFVSPHADFDVESVEELPSKNTCVIIEDAHKRSDVDKMVAALMRFSYWDMTKVIISTRPSGESAIGHALSTYDPQEVEHMLVSPLDPHTHSFELAKATLSTEDESLAHNLVRASDGNCLVITVGGTLIKERKVDKSLLEDENFKNIVLDKLLEDLEEGVTSAAGLDITELLATVAGVGPVVITSEEFQKSLCEDLNVEWHELSTLIDQLENKGLILRRGRKIRIIPDVLADHILLKQSANIHGEPTRFIDKLFGLYGGLCFSNILSNVAEIEYNTSLGQEGTRLLRNVWDEIYSFMKDENTKYDDLSSILDKLCPAVIFAPHNTLELCKWLIRPENLIKPSRQGPLSGYIDAQTVLEKIPPLLRRIGWHPTCTTEVCEILWSLANTQLKKANVNPYPQHPWRLLKELASLDNHNYFSIVENALLAIENIIGKREHHSSCCDIQEALENTLKQEVENTSSDRRTFTLSWTRIYSCEPKDRIRSIRIKALKLLEILATDDDPKTILRTSQSLLEMLSVSHRGPNGVISDAEVKELTIEAEMALAILCRIIQEDKHPVIANELKNKLRSKEFYAMESIGEKLNESIKGFDSDDLLYQVQYCMSHEWPDYDPDEGHDVSQKKFEEMQEDVARALWRHADNNPDKLVAFIKEVVLEYGKAGVGCEARSFQHACASVRPDKASDAIGVLLGEDNLYLAVSTGYWFFHLDPESRYLSAKRIIEQGNKDHKRGLTACLSSLSKNSKEEIIDIASSLANDPDKDVKYTLAFNLARLYERRSEVKELLDIYCGIDTQQDANLLNHLLGSVGKKHGINSEHLSDGHVEQLLARIEVVKKLGQSHYWIGDFLDFCRNKRPKLLVELFLKRIEKDIEIHEQGNAGDKDEYQPFPYLGFNYSSATDITNHAEFESCLQLILEATKIEQWEYSFWCPKIFKWLDHNFSSKTQQYLSGILRNADKPTVIAIGTLLGDFDPGIVFVVVDFICLLLAKAHELGNDCHKSVCSKLHGMPFTGTHAVSPPGEPDHHHLAIAQSCEATMKRELPDPAREFYESVKGSAEYYAKQKTEEDRLEEEEEGI